MPATRSRLHGCAGELLDLRGERYVVPGYALPDLVAGDARPVERDFDRPGRERHRFQHMSHPFFAELVAEFASRLVVADGADRAAAQPELRHVVGEIRGGARRSFALRAVCPRVLRRSRQPTLSFGLLRYSLSIAFAAKLTVLLDIFPLARCFSTWREAFGRNFRGIRFVLPGRFPTTGRTNYARKVCIERLLSYFCLTQNPNP